MAEKGKTPYYFPSGEADVVPWTRNFITVLDSNSGKGVRTHVTKYF
jgi:hypothetical protein